MARPVVLKLGGELLEDASRTRAVAGEIARAAATMPIAVVHGGGREIDAALSGRANDKKPGGVQRVHNWVARGIPARVKLEHAAIFLKPPVAAEVIEGANIIADILAAIRERRA